MVLPPIIKARYQPEMWRQLISCGYSVTVQQGRNA